MIDQRIHRKIPFLNDYGSALFEKGVLLFSFSLINFCESYRSSSAGRRIICREFLLLISVCVSITSWRTTILILALAYKRMKEVYTSPFSAFACAGAWNYASGPWSINFITNAFYPYEPASSCSEQNLVHFSNYVCYPALLVKKAMLRSIEPSPLTLTQQPSSNKPTPFLVSLPCFSLPPITSK